MGIRDNAINLFEEQRALTDDEMQAYKDMLRRKENKWEYIYQIHTNQKDVEHAPLIWDEICVD